MKISVVMTTYNSEEHIEEQLQSLLSQTRKIDEVLIFDDQSKDATSKIVKDFINHNNLSGWIYTINEKNLGWETNFMQGLAKASGDLIFPCDHDDIWALDKVEFMENMMKSHPEAELLVANYEALYENGNREILPVKTDQTYRKINLDKQILRVGYPGCTYCCRKELIDEAANYWRDRFPHDATLWRIGLLRGTVYAANKPVLTRRIYSQSASATLSSGIKSFAKRREWLNYANSVLTMLEEYANNEDCEDKSRAQQIISDNQIWIKERKKFFDSRNPLTGLKLLRYTNLYPNKFKSYLVDWYAVYFKH